MLPKTHLITYLCQLYWLQNVSIFNVFNHVDFCTSQKVFHRKCVMLGMTKYRFLTNVLFINFFGGFARMCRSGSFDSLQIEVTTGENVLKKRVVTLILTHQPKWRKYEEEASPKSNTSAARLCLAFNPRVLNTKSANGNNPKITPWGLFGNITFVRNNPAVKEMWSLNSTLITDKWRDILPHDCWYYCLIDSSWGGD